MKEFLIIIFLFLLSCGRNYRSDTCTCNYVVSVPANIVLKKEEVDAAISGVLKKNRTDILSIEIVIFGYTSGKEVFSFPGNTREDTSVRTYEGNIKALLKIKRQDALAEVLFLKAVGNGKEEILRGLAGEIRRVICNNNPSQN